jgi:hypothetical protein
MEDLACKMAGGNGGLIVVHASLIRAFAHLEMRVRYQESFRLECIVLHKVLICKGQKLSRSS